MTTDLTLLVWSVALTWVQSVISVIGAMLQVGPPALAGNREGLPEITGWAGRAARAHRNMLEGLILFAALVLIARVTGRANATTALGSELFFWSRVAYLPVYVVGVPGLRTGVWAVSVIGLVMIFVQVV